jgi:DinB superfamily
MIHKLTQTHYSNLLHEATLENAVSELAEALDSGIDAMKDFSEERAEYARAAGKWTPKELLGHLIDSAVNNHQRFVRAQIPAHLNNGVLELDGYAQNDWVAVNHYATRDWGELLELWDAMNTHILHLMDNVDPSKLQTHVKISGGEPITLEALMVDYVGHQKHHLAQILED